MICVFVSLATHVAWAQESPTKLTPQRLIDQVGIKPNLGERAPLELEFVDARGASVRLADLLGERSVLLHLVYYECPMLCKLSADGLLGAVGELSLKPGTDFDVVTVSIDPREGPALSAKARDLAADRLGAEAVDRGWHFLTGRQDAITALCDAVGFRYAFDAKTGQFAHASGVFILTPDGRMSRYLSGVKYQPRDLRLAIVEASEGKVGTTADSVLLMCYMYDPTTGKYGLAVMTGLRVAGVATVVAMAAGIAIMLKRDRARQQARAEKSLLEPT